MFPGAGADRSDAAYAVVGAPLDASASFRPGARFGPERIRAMARGFEDYDHSTDAHFSALGVHDCGDVRAWNDAPEYLEFLDGELSALRREDILPLLLGGEHTVTVAGVCAADPDVVVSLDAHLDLRESYDGDPYSHATVLNHALDVADDVVVVGARAGSEAEWERARDDDVTVVGPDEADKWVPPDSVTDPDATVYLTVDVDVADPAYAPGTGTPEPGGLTARECRRLVRAVAPHADGFDAVEVTDRDDGQAALLAGKLLREFVFAHAAGDG